MLEAMLSGLQQALGWHILGLMLIATFIGNFFGIVPGLGGQLALALMIPFVFGMNPFAGIAFLLAMHSVTNTGGSIPGILFGIPGTSSTAATIVDGFPMTRKGKGGEAMGAQLAASGLGGIIGAAVLALFIPILRPIAITFGPSEIFMLIVFGLTFIIVISRESIAKGFTCALLGLLLGTVGLDPHTGVARFTFDQLCLYDGVHVVIIVLGVFAFAEVLTLGSRGRKAQIAESSNELTMSWGQLWEGTKEVFLEWWLSLRTAIIGTFIGIVPGLGGDAATWICYGHAVQTCKNNENFGKGDIRGVIGVETANNSKEGGALLPTLVFGIPGSAGMAILLGAFLILGIVPGPSMIIEHLDLVWGMVWIMVIANIFGAVSLYPLCGYMGKLAFLRGSLIIPGIIVLASVGAFLMRGFWQDLVMAVALGFFGYGMKKRKYPQAPLIMGFILGPLAEDYLHKSLDLWGIAFLARPVVLVLLIMVILSLLYSAWHTYKEKMEKKREKLRSGAVFSLILFVIFSGTLYLCLDWSMAAKFFPLLIGITGIGFSGWLVYNEIRRWFSSEVREGMAKVDDQKAVSKAVKREITPKAEVIMALWLLGFLGMILVFGFWVTIAAFTLIFMSFFGRENWKLVSTYTLIIWLGIYIVFDVAMKVSLYGGILELSW